MSRSDRGFDPRGIQIFLALDCEGKEIEKRELLSSEVYLRR
jgi:hypothetical protein